MHDLWRRAILIFYSRVLGGRDYSLFETVHFGLRLPATVGKFWRNCECGFGGLGGGVGLSDARPGLDQVGARRVWAGLGGDAGRSGHAIAVPHGCGQGGEPDDHGSTVCGTTEHGAPDHGAPHRIASHTAASMSAETAEAADTAEEWEEFDATLSSAPCRCHV